MKTTLLKPAPLSAELERHLRLAEDSSIVAVGTYVTVGSTLMTPAAIASLEQLGPQLALKIAGLPDGGRLRSRVEVLSIYFDESARDPMADPAVRRDVGFALLYFLKGFDRIPDSIPEVGLVDDALVIDAVIEHREPALRAHWSRRLRPWPHDL